MSIKIVRNSAVAALLFAALAYGAVKGDTPFAKYGTLVVGGYDAGTGAPKCIGIAGQNSVMVRNLIMDGGTSQNMYCGFDTSVQPYTGMPVLATETLTVDVGALATPGVSTPPPYLDGGVINSAVTATPQLCCIQLPGTSLSDMHWMIVK